MNRCWLVLALAQFAVASHANDLLDEIRDWKPGREVPHWLLSYPDGVVEDHDPVCSFSTEDSEIAIYIGAIDDDALLEAIVFDHRSESSSFKYALMRLVERKGMEPVAQTLMTREPTRWEHEALRQLLLTRYAKLSVASISTSDMPREKALDALGSLKRSLEAGKDLPAAYSAVADQNPDIQRNKKEPGASTTLVTYLFDGWVSEQGYVFSQLGVNPYLPSKHLPRVFGAGRGSQLIEEPDEVYLYYVSDFYEPEAH